ncbi:CPBP family intramembrane glutamic endopeptidase [Corynebacterium pelargi]|uniref:CAAX amino terminal protease self-immunity n=1 Tax=Corynebacterium pelargi TaxID=1471400 RepID=A0A410W6L8_9CORY|nr:type II CAAX endopeptidase family protein [Corynebacterium pelargi]QAU51526.1 CAAX amino terminal protease self- immunity [Corynebacterium pelargi]GGG79769.1 hypothetical protein GCM10007338_17680 [Corynebacterium pelargi]
MNTYQQHVAAIPSDTKKKLIALPILVALVVLLIIPGVFQYGLAPLIGSDPEQLISPAGAVGMIAAVTLGSWLMAKTSGISFGDLGIKKQHWASRAITGAVWGILALSAVGLIINVLGGTRTTYVFDTSMVGALVTGVVFFAFQGTWEELIYRAYLMPHFSKVMGNTWSVIVTSLLFTLFHGLNPGMTLMPILNLLVASIVFSLIYIKTGNLLLTGLAHGMWNFSQGFIFGSLVSGNTTPGSLFASAPKGSELISGGSFGFEGSIVTTFVGVVIIAFLLSKLRKTAR